VRFDGPQARPPASKERGEASPGTVPGGGGQAGTQCSGKEPRVQEASKERGEGSPGTVPGSGGRAGAQCSGKEPRVREYGMI